MIFIASKLLATNDGSLETTALTKKMYLVREKDEENFHKSMIKRVFLKQIRKNCRLATCKRRSIKINQKAEIAAFKVVRGRA